ncbi:LysR family transcriptional regulator [Vibrio sp. S4M6]|uniref:LysR family transcriptional regulator n=1 Tax=Vibrio sinus TaxID=2946865 RepID=UPI00202A5D17|nr:LysR family transcriptional regulator [Vibrio sinus]MCL9782516.1 LysR family transcriptional regulator [Vibrio sinus]
MINQVNLADIRTFVLIAQLGNFTKAAEALAVSRSHVSRQVSQLESQVGATLLIRTTRTLKLTEAGRQFFKQCELALNQINQAILATVDDVNEVRGHIKINSVGGYLGEELIAQIALEFGKQYPEVTIQLDFSSHRVDLIDEDFDIAFRMGELQDASFIARKVMNIEMGTWASPEYLTKHGYPASPKDLQQHLCLTGSVTRWSFIHQSTSESTDVQVAGHLQCKNGHVLVKGALNGSGIIRTPYLYCRREIEQGKLVPVFHDWTIPSVDFSAIYHKDRYQPQRLRAFIEFTKQWMNDNIEG